MKVTVKLTVEVDQYCFAEDSGEATAYQVLGYILETVDSNLKYDTYGYVVSCELADKE